jgi:hypothetical protein
LCLRHINTFTGVTAMTNQDNKALISIRAFEGRMKRHMLAKENEEMKKCRADSRWYADMGPYYFVGYGTNVVTDRGISLETLITWAREDGVLKPYEEVDCTT